MKCLCVLDACSALNCCRVELKRKKLIYWIVNDFYVFISSYAFGEFKRNLNRLPPDEAEEARAAFFDNYTKKHTINKKQPFSGCICVLRKESKSSFGKIDRGERESASLALSLGRCQKQDVLLVTDDFDAICGLKEIFMKQQIGSVLSSFDIVLNIFARHPRELAFKHVENAIRSLMYIFERDQPITRETATVPEQIGKQFLIWIKEVCHLACEKRECGDGLCFGCAK